jgi:chromosome partitioning protein
MALTICMLNNKGGVGKTSTVHHLSGEFAKRGRRVLLLDVDPQANLTQGFLGSQAGSSVPAQSSVAALFEDSFAAPQALIRPTGVEGIFLVPGSRSMQKHDIPCPEQAGHRQLVLRDFVREVGGGFDVVVIDCPPNIYLSAWSALCASDAVIVPVQPEDYGAQGIAIMREVISAVQAGPNAALKLLGYLITMRNRRLGIHTVYENTLREMYGADVFAHNVPLATCYKEAIAMRLPVSFYKPRTEAGRAMSRLADEIMERAAGILAPAARRVA